MKRALLALAVLGVLAAAAPAMAQTTATANFTFGLPSPIDKATQTFVDFGAGAGCNVSTGCATWAASPGSPIAASAVQFSQPNMVVGTLACWRFTRKGGGSLDGDPIIVCGTPDKNGKLQNMILIFQ